MMRQSFALVIAILVVTGTAVHAQTSDSAEELRTTQESEKQYEAMLTCIRQARAAATPEQTAAVSQRCRRSMYDTGERANTPTTAASARLPFVSGGTISDFQTTCEADPAFKKFAAEVHCIEGLIVASPRSAHSQSNPDVKLYTLTADKLVEDVKRGATTPAAARLELQRTYLEIRQRQNAEAESTARMAALQQEQQARKDEAEQAAEDAQRRHNEEQMQAQAVAQAAVQACIQYATARNQALAVSTNLQARGMALGNSLGGNFQRNCSQNPNWYQAIPLPPPPRETVNTHCSRDLIGGMNCTTQ